MLRINDIQSGIEEKILSKNYCSFIPSISDRCITQQLDIGRVARLADISISILHYRAQEQVINILLYQLNKSILISLSLKILCKAAGIETGNWVYILYFYILIIPLHEIIETSTQRCLPQKDHAPCLSSIIQYQCWCSEVQMINCEIQLFLSTTRCHFLVFIVPPASSKTWILLNIFHFPGRATSRTALFSVLFCNYGSYFRYFCTCQVTQHQSCYFQH